MNAKKQARGRPFAPPGEKMASVTVRLSPAMIAALDAAGDRSDIIRTAVEAYLTKLKLSCSDTAKS